MERFDALCQGGAKPTPFLFIEGGFTDRLLALLDRDPSQLQVRNTRGRGLLHAAGQRLHTDKGVGREIADALIKRGATHDVFSAAAFNEVEILQDLLADPNAEFPDGTPLLMCAAWTGATDAVRLLLAKGANPTVAAIEAAASGRHAEIVELLLDQSVDVSDELVLSSTWSAELLSKVLKHGGDPNAFSRGFAAIHWATFHDTGALAVLLNAGADPDVKDMMTKTPLHIAVDKGEERVRTLLRYGADPSISNANGDTPLDDAIAKEKDEVAALLRAAMRNSAG